jgi:hypothetical protein
MTKLFLPCAVLIAAISLPSIAAAQSGEPARQQAAQALLEHAIHEVKRDRANAFAQINAGRNGFKADGIGLFCANGGGKLVANSERTRLGQDINAWRDRVGKAYGREIMRTAVEGQWGEIDYVLIRRPKCGPPARVGDRIIPTGCPGIRISVPRRALFARTGDLVCAVEFSSRQDATPRQDRQRQR